MKHASGTGRHAVAHPRRRRIWLTVFVLLLALVLGTLGWVWYNAQRAVDDATQGQGGAALDILTSAPLDGESTGRVNILLAGNSFDEKGHEGAALTDSIMVASMNLTTRHVAIISIPRDLWVQYNGEKMKINAVYPVAASGNPGAADLGNYTAGMGALGQVVETVTGLHINQDVLVGYSALKDTVDAVGGIDVVIEGTKPDGRPEPRGIYDPAAGVNLQNGPQHIDGLTALRISRARNDHEVAGNEDAYGVGDNDWGRQRNQRMILTALQQKIKSTPALANPATMVSIFNTVSKNVRTDLSVHQVRRVYDLTNGQVGMTSVSIKGDDTHELLKNYKAGDLDAVVPTAGRFDYSEIQQFVAAACAA